MTKPALRLAGAALLAISAILAGAWVRSIHRTPPAARGIPVPAGQASAPNPSDLAQFSDVAGPPQVKIPDKLPQFSLGDRTGKATSIQAFSGKSLIINFWATWCAPCKIETPWLIELEKQYHPKGFEILGVSFDDLDKDDPKLLAKDKAGIEKAVAQLHISYPVLLDGDSIAKPYGDTDVYPTSFFVDRSGTIVAATFGLTSKSDLEDNIVKALGEGK